MKVTIVLDANILIRALLGIKVCLLLLQEQTRIRFVTTQIAFEEVEEHLPSILKNRGLALDDFAVALQNLPSLVEIIPQTVFRDWLPEAVSRLTKQDVDDAHLLALALALSCPIWTKDRDFFGIGIVTWRTGLIERFFTLL